MRFVTWLLALLQRQDLLRQHRDRQDGAAAHIDEVAVILQHVAKLGEQIITCQRLYFSKRELVQILALLTQTGIAYHRQQYVVLLLAESLVGHFRLLLQLFQRFFVGIGMTEEMRQ